MISKNLAHAAVLAGYSVLLRTAAELIEDLQVDSPELRRRKLAHYGRPHLVCIDEVGYLSYDNHAADLLYEVINRRYEARSLIVTTHHADVTRIEGDSYRVRESEQEAASRRKKP